MSLVRVSHSWRRSEQPCRALQRLVFKTRFPASGFDSRAFQTNGGDDDETPHILFESMRNENVPQGVVSVLTLNRPKANAMGSTMLRQLQETLTVLEQQSPEDTDYTRCLVLASSPTASPTAFSAGADLKERAAMSVTQAELFVAGLRDTFDRVANLPIPVIAAVEGVALGGGLELALAADWRVASSTATFGLPETSLAIIPGAGGTQRLPRLIGTGQATKLIMTGARVDGTTAYQLGMVEELVEPGSALEIAMAMAWKVATNGPVAVRAAKQAVRKGMEAKTVKEALEMERKCYAQVLPTADRLEGLAAFRERRSPVYSGN